jgi:hypothetical protein
MHKLTKIIFAGVKIQFTYCTISGEIRNAYLQFTMVIQFLISETAVSYKILKNINNSIKFD